MVPLPIDEHLPAVTEALADGRDVVLVAEPGAGKTTRLPPAVLRAGLLDTGNLVMLQPRRVAARLAADRIARENDWQLGREVGYQVRFERVLQDDTPLRVVTEGVLARRIVDDPALEGVSCVVLDEFHERSLDADLCLAMLAEARALRDDLRIVVMSATLDAGQLARFLGDGAATFSVLGRAYPVDVTYAGDDPTRPIEVRVARVLRDRLESATGDVLVFLPGVREIEATLDEIGPMCGRAGYDVLPLHGSLTKGEQDEAVRGDADRPRVICATNIAETSITLPRVKVVIDSGLVRRAGHDAQRGVDTLDTVRISRASAEQRAGRAGRVAAGACIRLWSAMTHKTLRAYDEPEVRRSDVSRASLSVLAWGGDPQTFAWFERPDDARLAAATKLLAWLKLADNGRILPLGREVQRLPLPARAATLIALAPDHLRRDAITLAALLGEGADVPGRRTATVHDLLVAYEGRKLDATVDRGARRVIESLSRLRPRTPAADVESIESLLLLAFADRVCRRRSADSATMVDGGGIRLADPSAVRGDWFLALDARRGGFAKAQQADVRLVAEVEEDWLDATSEVTAEWTGDRVVGIRRKRYGDLVMDEQRGAPVPRDVAAAAMKEALLPQAEAVLAKATGDDLAGRVAFLRANLPGHLMPDGDAPGPMALVADACEASTKPTLAGVAEAIRASIDGWLWSSGWRRLLDEHAPTHVEVPTGSRIRLDWSEPVPSLSVRLQELFGLKATPRLAGGRVAVMLHLLAPNMRPQQTTDDLASFWANTYPQVRKDLRARYPKHSWPDDPLAAPPVRGTGRRRRAEG